MHRLKWGILANISILDNLSLKLPLLDDYYDLFYNFFSLVIYMHEKGVSIS